MNLKTAVAGGALALAVIGVSVGSAEAAPAAAKASSAAAVSPAASGALRSGTILRANHYLRSPNGRYGLLQQTDGNAVVYRVSDKTPLWSAETGRHRGAYLDFQANGNMVVYDRAHKPLWTSGTAGHAGSYLAMQNDGNLVIYSHGKKALWSWKGNSTELLPGETLTGGHSRLSANRKYRLTMQTDGNLVLTHGRTVLWNSRTGGHSGATFSFQRNGNLVVHSVRGTVLWQSRTHGAMTRLLVQTDGNLVLYHGKIAHWNSNTHQK
ncbi:MAG TPA: hypothetical protein VHX59_10595 [Mycobacteriales bacterium]|nr:hypothetical protein [Mycobacteriales bacterium]